MDTVPVQPTTDATTDNDASSDVSLAEFIGASRLNARLANTMAQLEAMLDQAMARVMALEAENATLREQAEPKQGHGQPLAAVPDQG